MKILTVADEECQALWDYYLPGRLADYDLILACGDLKSTYLSFLVTMARCPVLYVHGNHDTYYENRPPEGCDCIDDQIVTYRGVRIMGLGGCRRYRPGEHQYTENQMEQRIMRLHRKLRQLGGVDIVVTHAPPEGLGDAEDPAHWGFGALRRMLDKYTPAYLVHGHVHMNYAHAVPREIVYNRTRIINAYERYVLEIPDREYPQEKQHEVIWHTGKNRPVSEILNLPLGFLR